jgi:hypothetical protein
MKLRIEEQHRSQLTNDNTVRRKVGESDRKGAESNPGEVVDRVDVSGSSVLMRVDENRRLRVAELQKLYGAGELRYDNKQVAQSFLSHVDEEIDFDRLLRKPQDQEQG